MIIVDFITIHNSVPGYYESKYYIKGKVYTKEQYDKLRYRKEFVKNSIKFILFSTVLVFRAYVFIKYKI